MTQTTFDLNIKPESLYLFDTTLKAKLYRLTGEQKEFLYPLDVSFVKDQNGKATIKPPALGKGVYLIELLDSNDAVLCCWSHEINEDPILL